MSNINYINNVIPLPHAPLGDGRGIARLAPFPPKGPRAAKAAKGESEAAIRLRTDTVGTIRRALETKLRNELI